MDNVPRLDLVPPSAVAGLAQFYQYHEATHGKQEWMRPQPFSRILGSIKRHLWAFENGQDKNLATGLPHLTHVVGLATLLNEQSYYNPEFDDRSVLNRAPRCAVNSGLFLKYFEAGFVPHMNPLTLFTFNRDMQETRETLDLYDMKQVPVVYAEDQQSLCSLLKMMEIQVVITSDSELWSYFNTHNVTSALITEDKKLLRLPMTYRSLEKVPWLNPR